jgi:pimeloyl-ACP methyl ester carboxylesterase
MWTARARFGASESLEYHKRPVTTKRTIALIALLLLGGLVYISLPYLRATALLVRVAKMQGTAATFASAFSYPVTKDPPHSVPTRQGDVPAQFYHPSKNARGRTLLLIPGIHSMGINEPRLAALAHDLSAGGYLVMTMALPDLMAYSITTKSPDVIEDTVAWMAKQPALAADGKVGIVGISFAGGLATSAAGRPSIKDHVAFVLSFGGHGDMPRVMKYLATGQELPAPGAVTHPPHDYGVAVILYRLAEYGVVPADQVIQLREGVRTFLLASQLTLVNMDQANATFEKARDMATTMPEPSRTYMTYVNDRAVSKLGPVLVPFLQQLGADDPGLSPQRAAPPTAPVFLLHGDEDTVIPPAESVILGETLRQKGANVRVLLSHIITHAELDRAGDTYEAWKLVAFWADLLNR